MNKKIILILIIVVSILHLGAFGKPKKIKCNKPIYYFENVEKEKLFLALDELSQEKKYKIDKYYQELAFMSIKYNVKKQKTVPVLLKQFGSDAYLFIDISKSNTSLEKEIYEKLKKETKTSYLLRDNLFCKELTKDADSISTRRKSTLKEKQYNPGVYVIDMKRYVGYNKKTYFWNKFKRKKKADKKSV